MRGWRMKLIFLLMVYFAGFATAIYYFTPLPGDQISENCKGSFPSSAPESGDFAKSFNAGMHKCVDFGKDAVVHMCRILKQKLEERQTQNES